MVEDKINVQAVPQRSTRIGRSQHALKYNIGLPTDGNNIRKITK